VDRVSIERMCAGKEFQVEGADTEKARDEKLLVIPAGLVRRFVLEECKDLIIDAPKPRLSLWGGCGRNRCVRVVHGSILCDPIQPNPSAG